MNDPIKVPPAVLLSRIDQLWAMVKALSKQVEEQKVLLDDVREAFAGHSTFAHETMKRLDDRLFETDLKMIDVMEKLFPGHAAIQVQIKEVFKGKHTPDGDNHV